MLDSRTSSFIECSPFWMRSIRQGESHLRVSSIFSNFGSNCLIGLQSEPALGFQEFSERAWLWIDDPLACRAQPCPFRFAKEFSAVPIERCLGSWKSFSMKCESSRKRKQTVSSNFSVRSGRRRWPLRSVDPCGVNAMNVATLSFYPFSSCILI